MTRAIAYNACRFGREVRANRLPPLEGWEQLGKQFALIAIVALPLMVIYHILLVRAILEMLRRTTTRSS